MIVLEVDGTRVSIRGVTYAVDVIEDEISKQIGPIAKFIVNKCLVEMGKKRGDDLNLQELIEFIKKVSYTAIADPQIRSGVVKHISMKLEIKLNIDIER